MGPLTCLSAEQWMSSGRPSSSFCLSNDHSHRPPPVLLASPPVRLVSRPLRSFPPHFLDSAPSILARSDPDMAGPIHILVAPTTAHQRALRVPFYTLFTLSATTLAGLLLLFAFQRKKRHPTMISYVPSLGLHGVKRLRCSSPFLMPARLRPVAQGQCFWIPVRGPVSDYLPLEG